jgi:hypothetical protein
MTTLDELLVILPYCRAYTTTPDDMGALKLHPEDLEEGDPVTVYQIENETFKVGEGESTIVC